MGNLKFFQATNSNQDILLISICPIKIEIADPKLHTGHEHKYFFQRL